MTTTIQTVGEFEYGLEVTRDVYGFEFEFDFQYGKSRIVFPTVNKRYAGHEEVVDPPRGMEVSFSLRDPAAPPHIADLTWGRATSCISEGVDSSRPLMLNEGYIYRYLISIVVDGLHGNVPNEEVIEVAKIAFSKFTDWCEVISNQDVANGSAPISQGKTTQIWKSSVGAPITSNTNINCSYRTVIHGNCLSLQDLRTVKSSLEMGHYPDSSSILLRDSRRAFHNLDFRDSVLLAGVAAEVAMASFLLYLIDKGVDTGISENRLRNSAGLGEIHCRWVDNLESEFATKFTLNHKLRNNVAHRGVLVTEEQALDFYTECEIILLQTSTAYSHQ